MTLRQTESYERRQAAAEIARARPAVTHRSNGDEQRLRGPDGRPTFAGSFTKCLPHDEHGFLLEPTDFTEWARSIASGDAGDFRDIRIGPGPFEADGGFVFAGGQPSFAWRGPTPRARRPCAPGRARAPASPSTSRDPTRSR